MSPPVFKDFKNFVNGASDGAFFDTAADITLSPDVEGGLADIPGDSGGLTKFGISKASYPDEDIANLTMTRARFLACRDYWHPMRLDLINSQMISNNLFDFAFHHGVRSVTKKFQLMLAREFGYGGAVDGLMGSQTIGFVNKLIAFGPGAPWALHNRMVKVRIAYYLATAKPELLKGFVARAARFL
jgi:lysozyme family protein